MSDLGLSEDFLWLIRTYFSDPSQRVRLKKYEVLLQQGSHNDRLYLVLAGALIVIVENPDGSHYKLFKATPNMFVGVYSFFSKTYKSSATVIAEEDSEVAYIEQNQPIRSTEKGTSLFEQFMPVVVTDLALRQKREQEIAYERARTFKKLIQSEKLVSLGQMAAGIAHELNNAIAVLERNTQWLHDHLTSILVTRQDADNFENFKRGFQEGRRFSNRDVRARTKDLLNRYTLSEESARKLAEAGIPKETINKHAKELDKVADIVCYYWEIGATLYDMAIAAHHAAHVVKSVKNLATKEAVVDPHLDINTSINEAVALLNSPLRKIQVNQRLCEVPTIAASKGEMIQVWTNIITNAIESMMSTDMEHRELTIESACKGENIIVKIHDNGPGISEQDLPKIFQPDFTTKEKGLQFGLGLGLTIVERIIDSYGGDIEVKSKPGHTVFAIKLPVRG